MSAFGAIFLALLAAVTAGRLGLAVRQLRHVRAHRGEVPAAFQGRIDPEDQARAADYQRERLRSGMLETLADAGVILLLTWGGGLALLLELAQRVAPAGWPAGTLAVLAVAAISAGVALPFAAWRTFHTEVRFGFNRTTPALFVADLVKQGLVSSVLVGGLAAAVLVLMAAGGACWWVAAWAVWLGVSLALTWAYPKWIAPLFNRFRPLDDPALTERIGALLDRCGFALKGVFVMDASRRTAHGNAYFTGLGGAKRVVFFDTLLDSLGPAETEAVLAHELGHFRLGHIRSGVLVTAVAALAGLGLVAFLRHQPWFFQGLGLAQPADAALLILFALIGPVFAFPLRPLAAAWSRRREFAADAFASRHSDPQALASALVRLYRDNAAALTADPLYAAVYHSHPRPVERLQRLKA